MVKKSLRTLLFSKMRRLRQKFSASSKQLAFLRWHVNRDTPGNGQRVALTLIAMMVRVQDTVDLGHANFTEQLQDMAGSKIYEQGAGAIFEQVNIARVA